MNFTSKYEQFIAHFIPGTMSFFALLLISDGVAKPSPLKIIRDNIDKWQSLTIALLTLIPLILFIGLFVDGIKFWTVEPIFRKLIGRGRDDDWLVHIKNDDIGLDKYGQILGEYYYYYEFSVNGAFALILALLGLPTFCFRHGYLNPYYFFVLILLLVTFPPKTVPLAA
jgi:hypothetical protein